MGTNGHRGTLDFAKMGFPSDYVDIIMQAIDNPNNLTHEQLEELARTVCAKAFEKSLYSYPLSSVLVTICDKDTNQVFTQSLINCCREWYLDRSRLRPSDNQDASPRKHRWSAYLAFLTDFYLNLKSKLRGVILKENLDDEEESSHSEEDGQSDDDGPIPTLHTEFADLLYDCCEDIVRGLDTTNSPTAEVECLLNILRTVGKSLEKDRPERRNELISQLKVTFIGPVSSRLSDMCVKSILQMIECAASGWTFDQSQASYYYPSLS